MTNSNIETIARRVEAQIDLNKTALRQVENDSIVRESRQAYIIANGRLPKEEFKP